MLRSGQASQVSGAHKDKPKMPRKITICIPSYRDSVSVQTLNTLFALQRRLIQRGDIVALTVVGHAEISAVRNLLATAFLDSGADIMIGIDDDIGVDPDLAVRLLDTEHPYLGVYQPQRMLDLAAFHEAAKSGLEFRTAQLKAAPLVGPATNKTGVFQVPFISTSFFVLHLATLLRLIQHHNLQLRRMRSGSTERQIYGFYDNMILPDTGMLSEDYSFCQRLRQAEIPIHAYRGPGITHTGSMTFSS